MVLEIGNPHQIAAMASKSCNAVSKRTLYVPLTAEYAVSGRTYTVTVTLSCFFGTRININNTFTDINIGGEQLGSVTVDCWVPNSVPGKNIVSATFTGSFNADGTPDIRTRKFTASGNMSYFSDVSCQTRKSIPFLNEIELTIDNIEPAYTAPDTPTASLVVATDSRLTYHLETTSFGEGGGAFLYAEASKTNFGTVLQTSDALNTLVGDVVLVNLQRNTRYYIRATAANNGMSASAVPVTGVTLAASEITSASPIDGGAHVELVVYNGGGFYTPTTEIEMSTDLSTWTVEATTQSKASFATDITGLEAGQTYYFRAKTTTTAGVFYSNHVTFNAPGDLWGKINSITATDHSATVAWTAQVNGGGSVEAVFYYRVVGLEEEWVECHRATISSGSSASFTLNGLNQNFFEYEISADFRQGMKEYSSEPVQFHTIPSEVENNTCDSLTYLIQLICQELEAIKRGNITIFMNNDTKKWCQDELDDTPTLASMLTRVNRFMRAVGCTLCSMEGFIELLKDSKPNQVFMGKLGWVDIDEEVTEGSLSPASSNAIFRAVEELVHKVWHYVGDYDFYGWTLADLQSQTGTNGATGLVGDKVYTWSNNSWRNPQTIEPDNFGVVHVNDGEYAGNGYYWFVDGWNRLDLDDKEIRNRLEALEAYNIASSIDTDNYKFAIVDGNLTDAQIQAVVPTDVTRDTIILVKEYTGLPALVASIDVDISTDPYTAAGVSVGDNAKTITLGNMEWDSDENGKQLVVDWDDGVVERFSYNTTTPPSLTHTYQNYGEYEIKFHYDASPSASGNDQDFLLIGGVASQAFFMDGFRMDYPSRSNGNLTWKGLNLYYGSLVGTGTWFLRNNRGADIYWSGFVSLYIDPEYDWRGVIPDKFLFGCSVFDQPVSIVNKTGSTPITSVGTHFMSRCQSFNSNLTLPDTVTSISKYFMYACRTFNKPLSLPNELTLIDEYFLGACVAFNQQLTLPIHLSTICSYFMNDARAYNKPLSLPSSLTTVATSFMTEMDSFTGPLTVNSYFSVDTSSAFSKANYLSTNDSSAVMYTTGVTLNGPSAQYLKNKLPDLSTGGMYRKLILGGN